MIGWYVWLWLLHAVKQMDMFDCGCYMHVFITASCVSLGQTIQNLLFSSASLQSVLAYNYQEGDANDTATTLPNSYQYVISSGTHMLICCGCCRTSGKQGPMMLLRDAPWTTPSPPTPPCATPRASPTTPPSHPRTSRAFGAHLPGLELLPACKGWTHRAVPSSCLVACPVWRKMTCGLLSR